MRRLAGTILTVLILIIFLTGCSFNDVVEQIFGGQKSDNVLMVDNFTDPMSGWKVWVGEDGSSIDYTDGALRIFVNKSQFDYWSVAGKNYDNVHLESDIKKGAGPDDNDYGLICRYQDENNFYAFVISSDGYAGIIKVKNGEYQVLSGDMLQYSEAIHRGSDKNRLQAICNGSILTFSVNGIKLFEVTDEDFTSGDVGVIAGAYDTAGVEVFFDNFAALKP
ncbi:hypothetical protein LARV_02949 [Longilinea arvoryzae]|uniref:3-keto-disaccharide hydrolase domain-containing protein n=1 Tax=Longilinea arvoryzae TaxID=360412 RepID=A0A0S7BBI5_9CHLR|nr:hypothetical protein [Longilinea arvoryzae]GAP15167.1 hypothetical protein LARV_02949 [Longilinea arvoryzae]